MKRYLAILSSKAEDFFPALEESFDILSLREDKTLAPQVDTHPDMIVFYLGGRVVIPRAYHHAYPRFAKKIEGSTEAKVIFSDVPRGAGYPLDIALNVLVCGDIALGLKDRTAPEVKRILEDEGIRLVNVKQGYAACSSLALENAVISADPSVLRACRELGIAYLPISPGHIRLDGYSEGFIGGASGVCGRTVYFLGNISLHPDCKNILEFLETQGYSAVSLTDGELCDLGGIKFVENKL